MLTLNAAIDGRKVCQPHWDGFVAHHAAWFDARLAESDEVFFIPNANATIAFSSAFGMFAGDIAAEEAFTWFCREFRSIGVQVVNSRSSPRELRLLRYEGVAVDAVTDDTWLERGRILGWSEEQIANARIALGRADDMRLRLVSAAGKLVNTPAFLAERDALRARWTSLPPAVQPSLPLSPILLFKDQPRESTRVTLPQDAVRFMVDFDAFCDKWQLNGLESWDLPAPCAPQWPKLQSAPDAAPASGDTVLFTPWHFPALKSDELGRAVMERHLADRHRHGIDDSRSWQVYAQLFRLDVWERVLRVRYSDRARPRGFVREMEGLLAELLQVSLDRIERLRKLHAALVAGKRHSLKGVR